MNGHNKIIKRSKWEQEMYEKSIRAKQDRIASIVDVMFAILLSLGIIGMLFINYKFGYLLK